MDCDSGPDDEVITTSLIRWYVMFVTAKKLIALLTRRERWQLAALFAAILITALFQVMGVATVLPFVNMVMRPEIIEENSTLQWLYSSLGFRGADSFIFFSGLAVLCVIVTGNAVSAFATWLKLRFAWRKYDRLSRTLIGKYLSQPYVFFLNRHSADLSKNILNEVKVLIREYLIPLLTLLARFIVVALLLSTLLIVDPLVTLFATLSLGGSYTAIYLYFRHKLKISGIQRLEMNKQRFKIAGEAFNGIKDIKITGREHYFLKKYSKVSRRHADLHAWNAVVGQIPRYALETIAFGGVVLLVLFLLAMDREAHHIIPMVSFFAFAGYRMVPALQDIFLYLTKMKFHQATLEKIYEDLTEENGAGSLVQIPKNLPDPLQFTETIQLNGLTFYYPETKAPVLKEMSLSVRKNSAVAIVGPTGSGKTTLVDIILGLLTPQQGSLKVDGVQVGQHNYRSWQRNLGYVPQHIYLSDDTITRNIAFGVPDGEIEMEAVRRALRIANLDKFVEEELPDGCETVTGERGIRLSGGQRQRIGIARALYHDPEVLILDEATSSLDGIAEDAVLQAIENVARAKTLIIIAHRLTTVKHCDIIYLLEKGCITAHGTYDELINTNAQFRAMAKVKLK